MCVNDIAGIFIRCWNMCVFFKNVFRYHIVCSNILYNIPINSTHKNTRVIQDNDSVCYRQNYVLCILNLTRRVENSFVNDNFCFFHYGCLRGSFGFICTTPFYDINGPASCNDQNK